MSPLACCKDCPSEFDCVEEGCQRGRTATGISSGQIEMALKGVTWVAAPDQPQDRHDMPGVPFATHSGVWEFQGHSIRVYRLSDGRAIIDANDFWKILGIEDSPSAAGDSLKEKT